MKVGDKVKVVKLRNNVKDDPELEEYQDLAGRDGIVKGIYGADSGTLIDVEIDGDRFDLYPDELELVPGLESWCEGHPESPDPNRPGGFSRKLEAE